MCPGCGRLWTIVHVLCSIVYVACGATQLVAGIFFFITVPELHLSCNICSGAWNVIMGIAAGMVACFAQLSTRRQESLLYIAVSIIIVNAVNAVLTEWCLYIVDLPALIVNRPYQALISYACLATRIAIGIVILTSFVDSQLAFCSLQTIKKPTAKIRRSHEQVSDIEYIIPRAKSSKPSSIYNAYTQSWVFEADNSTNSPYLKLTQNGSAVSPAKSNSSDQQGSDNPVVHIQEASDDSGSDRKTTNCLKSFTPTASPIVLSASSSQLSLVHSNPPIYEYLERLTEPSVYRSRLNSALSNKEEEDANYQQPQSRRVEAITPQSEKVQYASLMKELQRAIGSKRESPQSSSTKSSDADFSKELEAALQLIHDLESPNTIETPSEPKAQACNNGSNSDSDKTLSAVGSLGESPITECHQELCTFKPSTQGKNTRLVHCDSQSTSGYSSPTLKSNSHTPVNWSTASSINSSHNDLGKTLSYTIHNTKSNAIISLYSQDSLRAKGKSVTLVNITNDDLDNHGCKKIVRRSSSGTGSLWNMRSLLRMKKQEIPKLCPELEGAIIKSESLAYLSELELLARHQRNKNLERQVEQRVLQQMGSPKTETDS